MRGINFLAVLALGTNALAAVTPITVKGNAFWAGSQRFYVRGVDYQPGGSSELDDPLATDNCLRDVPLFKELGLNTVRVYTVDNSKNHDTCMKALSDAGIYLILDVNTPKFSLNREYPKESYNEIYLQHVFATVDVFAKYTNTLGFFAANEVVNNLNNTNAATYVKATVRDMKAYIKKHVNRFIPVGYSAADVAENRMQQAHYFNCGPEAERIEFLGMNDYSWCGTTSFTLSGWNKKVQNFSDYSVPLFLSEYGCNTQGVRQFDEVEALYGNQMTPVYSGGLVYEYTQETNKYGLVDLGGNLNTKTPTKLPDFTNLAAMNKKVPIPTNDGGYHSNNSPSECPPEDSSWQATTTLPQLPAAASVYMESGAGQPRGTSGASNQWTPGKGTAPSDTGYTPAPTSGTSTGKTGSAPAGASSSAFAFTWLTSVIVFVTSLVGLIL